jgi:hypothetical protein
MFNSLFHSNFVAKIIPQKNFMKFTTQDLIGYNYSRIPKAIFSFLLFITFQFSSWAQGTTQTIRGTIVDNITK